MLRPSAPKAQLYDHEEECFKNLVLSTDNVMFKPDNSVVITFHGIKNDYMRDGFTVTVRPASQAKVCPVTTLRCYIERTKYQRPDNRPLFIALKAPFKAISSKTVAKAFDKAVELGRFFSKML